MYLKKSGGKIFGASLSSAEQRAMNLEIQRQLAEFDRKHAQEIDALVLWQLHEQLGFGPVRLRRFYDNFSPALDDLVKHYEMASEDELWLCTRMLKDYGIDLEQWEKDKIWIPKG